VIVQRTKMNPTTVPLSDFLQTNHVRECRDLQTFMTHYSKNLKEVMRDFLICNHADAS